MDKLLKKTHCLLFIQSHFFIHEQGPSHTLNVHINEASVFQSFRFLSVLFHRSASVQPFFIRIYSILEALF
jgi:hypothetical protein